MSPNNWYTQAKLQLFSQLAHSEFKDWNKFVNVMFFQLCKWYRMLMILSFFFLVKGRQFEVKDLFLEDILRLTDFNNRDMWKYKEETKRSMKFLSICSKFNQWDRIVYSLKPSSILTFDEYFMCCGFQRRENRNIWQSGVRQWRPVLLGRKRQPMC